MESEKGSEVETITLNQIRFFMMIRITIVFSLSLMKMTFAFARIRCSMMKITILVAGYNHLGRSDMAGARKSNCSSQS